MKATWEAKFSLEGLAAEIPKVEVTVMLWKKNPASTLCTEPGISRFLYYTVQLCRSYQRWRQQFEDCENIS